MKRKPKLNVPTPAESIRLLAHNAKLDLVGLLAAIERGDRQDESNYIGQLANGLETIWQETHR